MLCATPAAPGRTRRNENSGILVRVLSANSVVDLRLHPNLRISMAENKSEISQLPFLNTDFLKSPAARTIRILSEYLEPAERLRRARIRDTIVFFGSARSPSPEMAAQQLERVQSQIEQAAGDTPELAAA